MEVGGRLLQVLASSGHALMLKDLAGSAEMPPAKAHRYLVSLQRLGLVRQQASGLYDIGPLAIQLGLAGLARLDPVGLALDALPALRDACQCTVALSVWGNQGPTIIRWLETDALVSASLRTGAVMPLTRSATGRAFLGFHPGALQFAGLKREVRSNAQRGLEPASSEAVQHLARKVQREGVGRVDGDLVQGIASIAAPLHDSAGQLTLVATALGWRESFDASPQGAMVQAVKGWCASIETQLGRSNPCN
jgi:DNA-binding IclR family transcriptional regulator